LAATTAAGAAVVACQPKTVIIEKEVPVTQIVKETVKETVIVAGTPQEVTKVVEKVVEKVVTPTPEPAEPLSPAEQERRKTLIIGFEGGPVAAPEVANPYTPGARINQGYHQAMIESLWNLNYSTGELMPWVATGYEYNEDYTQVDIQLRKGVEWSDGELFTAEDVAFTLNMLRDNPGLSYGPDMEKWVEEATAIDDFTCQVTLTDSNPRFIYSYFTVRIWGAVRILPKHIWEDQDPMTFTNFDMDKGWPIFSGPYRLTKASANEFVYQRRDDWWGAKIGFHELPAPERLIFTEAGPEEKKAATLAANEVDSHPSMRFDTFVKVKDQNPHAIGQMKDPPYGWIAPCPRTLGFNCQVPPWDDPDMRWAVAYALDTAKIAEISGFGFGKAAPYFFPMYAGIEKWLEGNEDILEKYDVTVYDPEKAREIIESKGYTMGAGGMYAKGGEPLQVDILVKSGEVIITPLVVSYLRAVGIDAAPKALANAPYYDKRAVADFEIETTHVLCGSVAEPFGLLDQFHSRWIKPAGERRGGNIWGWANAEFDKIVEEMGSMDPYEPKQKELFRQAMEIQMRELPVLPTFLAYRIVPSSTKYWTNWPTEDNDYFHPPNWWNSTLMIIMKLKPA
jgi:peptide/nickel transport system substrate-binding protein